MVVFPASKKPSTVPFPAIVGQEDLKEVLLLAAAHDDLSGAVITGEKGTGKSTAVRALVDLLPDQQVVADCPYGCDPDDCAAQCVDCRERSVDDIAVETRPTPLVTLPLGATRDRVVGTLSVAEAMAGEAAFDPGLLARAHRGFLYVDEINLLDDHLVDVLLDAAASGINTVERDGVSVSHPAEFTFVGTMNPEEGELRPQLRDRFDLQATVAGSRDLDERVEIIDRALATDEQMGAEGFSEEVDDLRDSLRLAGELVESVVLPNEFKRTIADLCATAEVDGHRADIATARTAIAMAALDGRPKVIDSDIETAARYTLPHRLQSQPFEEPPDPEELLEDYFDDDDESDPDSEDGSDSETDSQNSAVDAEGCGDEKNGENGENGENKRGDANETSGSDDSDNSNDSDGGAESTDDSDRQGGQTDTGRDHRRHEGVDSSGEKESTADDDSDDGDDSDDETEATPLVCGQQRAAIGDGQAPDIGGESAGPDSKRRQAGRRTRSQSTGSRGTQIRTEHATDDGPIDVAASVRAAAASGRTQLDCDDLRESIRERETAVTIVFAVDASASMAPAMEATKGVVFDLLRDAYQQRDEIAFVAFGGDDAEVLLPPTRSVSLAARHLKELPTGDRTPLPAGLDVARQVVDGANEGLSVVVLVTDGRTTVAEGSPTEQTRQAARRLAASETEVVIVDATVDNREGLIPMIAAETNAETVPLSQLTPNTVSTLVEQATTSSPWDG